MVKSSRHPSKNCQEAATRTHSRSLEQTWKENYHKLREDYVALELTLAAERRRQEGKDALIAALERALNLNDCNRLKGTSKLLAIQNFLLWLAIAALLLGRLHG